MGNQRRPSLLAVSVGYGAGIVAITGLALAWSSHSSAILDIWWITTLFLGFLLVFHGIALLARPILTAETLKIIEYFVTLGGAFCLVVAYVRQQDAGWHSIPSLSHWAALVGTGALALAFTCTSVNVFKWHRA